MSTKCGELWELGLMRKCCVLLTKVLGIWVHTDERSEKSYALICYICFHIHSKKKKK